MNYDPKLDSMTDEQIRRYSQKLNERSLKKFAQLEWEEANDLAKKLMNVGRLLITETRQLKRRILFYRGVGLKCHGTWMQKFLKTSAY